MLNIDAIKRGVLPLFFIIFLVSNAKANSSFVLENENNIIANKTAVKIDEIADELKAKMGIGVYLILKDNISDKSLDIYIKKHYANILQKPYVIYMLSKKRKLIDIITNIKGLDKVYDKDDIIYNKTLRIIVTPGTKSSQQALYSAGLLNGFSQLCEDIASSKKIKLDTAIGSESSNTFGILRYLFYMLLIYFLFLFIKKKYIKK